MTARELREKYIQFFEERGHKAIPSASLLPENDPSVLFTTAGMHPLVPYLMGESHAQGKRLVNFQKCIRVDDIDEVGDSSHNTFFEMLGNWSLGDYFKSESIRWSWDFLTSKKWLGLSPERLSVTCFAGDSDSPRDDASAQIWREIGLPDDRIHFLPKTDNWWGLSGGGPCGPDTEIFYDVDPDKKKCSDTCGPGCDCGKYFEIWNNVFMEYDKKNTGTKVMMVRHAQTDWNSQKRIQGDLEIELDVDGKKQAEKFRSRVHDFKPNVILTSPLVRSERTAKILAPKGVKVVVEPLAIERDMGELEGMTQQELLDSCPSDMFIKKGDVYYCSEPPGGESLKDTKNRAGRLFSKILKQYRGKNVLIVTHGDVLDMATAEQKGLRIEDAIGMHPSNMATEVFDLHEYLPLQQKNVDTGMGVERTVAALNGLDDIYKTELFWPTIKALEGLCGKVYGQNQKDTYAFRVIADHIRAAVFILGDDQGVVPSNLDQGYILRRLLRRAVRFTKKMGIPREKNISKEIANAIISQYQSVFPELGRNRQRIITEIQAEEGKFELTLDKGLKQFNKVKSNGINGKEAFDLFQTYGFPLEMTEELAAEMGVKVDRNEFKKEFAKHQAISRQGAAKKFKGGLADDSAKTARLHTATHLLLAALRQVLGNHVRQKGSNITTERLRFDFSHPDKLTDEEKAKVESLVNDQIAKDLPIEKKVMTIAEAKRQGAIGVFIDKYGEKVNVYCVPGFSKEICGGPHAKRTGELGHFRIKKEQSSSAGVRRIKAVLE